MIIKLIALVLVLFAPKVFSAECTLYETMHPSYPLTGSHLSTGKCSTCAACHVPAGAAVFMGTPRTCIACHNGDPRFNTVMRSPRHLPTMLVDCSGCHNTLSFSSRAGITQSMIHNAAYPTIRCDSCHNGMYTSYGADGKSRDHPTTVTRNGVKILVSSVDCNYCHSPNRPSFD